MRVFKIPNHFLVYPYGEARHCSVGVLCYVSINSKFQHSPLVTPGQPHRHLNFCKLVPKGHNSWSNA